MDRCAARITVVDLPWIAQASFPPACYERLVSAGSVDQRDDRQRCCALAPARVARHAYAVDRGVFLFLGPLTVQVLDWIAEFGAHYQLTDIVTVANAAIASQVLHPSTTVSRAQAIRPYEFALPSGREKVRELWLLDEV